MACGRSERGSPQIGIGYSVKTKEDLLKQINEGFKWNDNKPLSQLVLDDSHSNDVKSIGFTNKSGSFGIRLKDGVVNISDLVAQLKKEGKVNKDTIIALSVEPGINGNGLQELADNTGLKVVVDLKDGKKGVSIFQPNKPKSEDPEGQVNTSIGLRGCGGPGGYTPPEKRKSVS